MLDLDILGSPDRVIFLTKNRPLRCQLKGRDASPTLDPISTAIGYACLFSRETKLVTKGVREERKRDQVKRERDRDRDREYTGQNNPIVGLRLSGGSVKVLDRGQTSGRCVCF